MHKARAVVADIWNTAWNGRNIHDEDKRIRSICIQSNIIIINIASGIYHMYLEVL